MKHTYENKRFSILGDSISTLDGYSIPEDSAFYKGTIKFYAKVYVPEDTWWGQVVQALGGEILVNNSISGSMVCKHPHWDYPSYGCSDERTYAFGKDGISPDVILVWMGTNDWGAGMITTPVIKAHEQDLAVFSVAYDTMLRKLQKNYPNAEIWCLTPAVSTNRSSEQFSFPYYIAGRHIADYCQAIRACAEANGCRLIDMYTPETPYDTLDDFHPNADGMKTLAEQVLRQIPTEF